MISNPDNLRTFQGIPIAGDSSGIAPWPVTVCFVSFKTWGGTGNLGFVLLVLIVR